MLDKEIIEYAIKGLSSEIEKSQLTVARANNYICSLEEGKSVKTPKTIDELKELQNKHNKIIHDLFIKKEELEWLLATEYE